MPLQQFLLVREHVLDLLASEPFARRLPVVPGESLAVSDIARAYLAQALARRAPTRAGNSFAESVLPT